MRYIKFYLISVLFRMESSGSVVDYDLINAS